MTASTPGRTGPRYAYLLKWALAVLGVLYLINCFTPLRLHIDAIRYFRLEQCMEYRCAPGSIGAGDYLPYGYTFLLLTLSKLGILRSFAIVLMNCFYLFAGLGLLRKTLGLSLKDDPYNRGSVNTFVFLILVLLNWSMIKFMSHPLSEMQFIFFSFSALYTFQQYILERKWWLLALAFGLCFVTILTRTAGIALLPAFLFSLVWTRRDRLIHFAKNHKVALGLVLALGLAGFVGVFFFSKQLGITFYTSFVTGGARHDMVGFVTTNLGYHFQEMTELLINASSAKVYRYMNPAAGKVVFVGLGIIFLAWCIYNLVKKRDRFPVVVRSYLVFYLLLIFNWPFYDPRFLVPVLPIIFAVLLLSRPLNGFLRTARSLYLSFYVVLGVLSVLFYTYTSTNKEALSRTQANGVFRNEYETVFFGKPQSDTARRIDPEILDLLRHYSK